MFAFSDVMHLLTYEFTRLSAGRLAFARVLTRTLDGFSFRHKTSSFVERVRGKNIFCRGTPAIEG